MRLIRRSSPAFKRAFGSVENVAPMTTWKKIALVLAGYVAAIVVAFAVVYIYILATDNPDRQASSGMYAFGDSLLFLAVLGVASLPATAAALVFLRGCRVFWGVLSVLGLALAATGGFALFALLAPPAAPGSWLQILADLSPLRALVAPLFAMVFLLAGILAPVRWSRIALLLVAAMEAGVFGLTVLHWIWH